MKNKKSIIFILLFFLLTCGIVKNEQMVKTKKENIFHYEQNIVLSGKIELIQTNDADGRPWAYYQINLFTPITVLGNTNSLLNYDSYTNIKRLQIVHLGLSEILKKSKQKKIFVRGKLFEQISGHHFTPVLIEISNKTNIKSYKGETDAKKTE